MLFDRSWYNRAGVERVMGFCTDEEYEEFLRSCPEFERMLIRSGIILVKYWFSVSDEEQERRFQERIDDPDQALEAEPDGPRVPRARWVDYSRAKDEMFAYTDTKQVAVVGGRRRRQAPGPAQLHRAPAEPGPLRGPHAGAAGAAAPPGRGDYVRPPMSEQTFVPDVLP